MNNSLISVVMPVYNAENFLHEAIQSVLNQDYIDFEFIIIDDGSTDNSPLIINCYKDSRIRYFRHEKNLGLIDSLNHGIKLSQGKYIARMDADDICHFERFKKQLVKLENSNADICGCHWHVINEKGKLIDNVIVPIESYYFPLSLSNGSPFAHGSVMIRSDFIKKNNLLYGSEKYAEDLKLWIEFFERGAILTNCNEFLFSYRNVNTSVSKINRSNYTKTALMLRRNFVKKNYNVCVDTIKFSLNNINDFSYNEKLELFILVFYLSKIRFINLLFFFKIISLLKFKEVIHGFYRVYKA